MNYLVRTKSHPTEPKAVVSLIVGLMLCDPPPLFIIPKCFTQMLPPFASAIPQTKAASFRNKRITDKV